MSLCLSSTQLWLSYSLRLPVSGSKGLNGHLTNSIQSKWNCCLVRELSKSERWDYPGRWWVKLSKKKSNSATGFQPTHTLPILLYTSPGTSCLQISKAHRLSFAWIGMRPICFISDCELVDAHLIMLALVYDCSCECIPRWMCVCVCLQVCARARRWFPWRARQMGREWICSFSLPPESHEGIQRRCPTLNPLTEVALFWFSRSAQHNRKVNWL